MNNHKRIRELEDKAIELYLNEADWQTVISHLTNEEHDEYWRLVNEKCGFYSPLRGISKVLPYG